MDSNDPNNPNNKPSLPFGAAPVDPLTPPQQTPGWSSSPDQSATSAPLSSSMPVSDSAQLNPTAAPNPWSPVPVETVAPEPGFSSPSPNTPTASREAAWPANPQATAPTDVPTAPMAPSEPVVSADNPAAANPFLQPQAGTFNTSPAFEQPAAPMPLPEQPAAPYGAPTTTTPDPLNTAFTPTPPQNPFEGATALPTDPTQPAAPTVNPWDQPAPTESQFSAPTAAPAASPAAPVSDPMITPTLDLNVQPGNPPQETAQIQDQTVSAGPQSEAMDLSTLQTGLGATTVAPNADTMSAQTPQSDQAAAAPTASPLPDMGPVENAPTDLSHLIAGDETSPSQTNGVYTPPIAADQNLNMAPASATPTQPAEGDAPPPGKHLNLTKVLLVAGIPIILIVAALSAYLILGVGQANPTPTDQTSLPVEQTQQTQAPLTNPPQQIVAPSPVPVMEPTTDLVSSPSPAASPSPEVSLSPAMRAAQQKASPTPSGSPAASAGTSSSLPIN